jgi:hypothetical protein
MRFILCVGLVLTCAASSARAAIVIDGAANEPEWATAATADNTVPSNWTTANRLDRLRAFTDANYLYVAIDGTFDGSNAIMLYVDGRSYGVSDLPNSLFDNLGQLDALLSSSLVINAQFGADLGWGTLDLNRSVAYADDRMGWRDVANNPSNFDWLTGTAAPTTCGAALCETKVPLSSLNGIGVLRLFARLCDASGTYYANQCLPMDDPVNPTSVNTWLTVRRALAVGVFPEPLAELRLHPCQPNPFNPRTTIRFDLPAAGNVRLAVYDVAGRLVRVLVAGERPAGSHEAVWDGRDASGRSAPSGSYLARLVAGGKVEGVRLSLVR